MLVILETNNFRYRATWDIRSCSRYPLVSHNSFFFFCGLSHNSLKGHFTRSPSVFIHQSIAMHCSKLTFPLSPNPECTLAAANSPSPKKNSPRRRRVLHSQLYSTPNPSNQNHHDPAVQDCRHHGALYVLQGGPQQARGGDCGVDLIFPHRREFTKEFSTPLPLPF